MMANRTIKFSLPGSFAREHTRVTPPRHDSRTAALEIGRCAEPGEY